MTSLAFIGGMIPLFIASGAGAASRIAVGTGVVGGMLAATVLGIFFIPVFYLSIRRWLSKKRPAAPGRAQPAPNHAESRGANSDHLSGRVPVSPASSPARAADPPGRPHHMRRGA